MIDKYKGKFWDNKKDELNIPFRTTALRLASFMRARDQKGYVQGVLDAELFPEVFNPENVLDVGSGYGGSMKAWRKNNRWVDGNRCVHGVEPDPELAAKTGVLVGTFSDVAGYKYFNLILVSHVLEHIEINPFFKKLDEILSDEGFVFVEVPCCDNPIVDKISRLNPNHIHHFTEENLLKLFERYGYEPVFFQFLISKIDHVMDKKHLIPLRILELIFTKFKSYGVPKEDADVIRLIARRKKKK